MARAYKYVTKYTSPNQNARNSKITGVTIHWWGRPSGQNPLGIVSWLCDKRAGTSAHYVVSEGTVWCIVDPDRRAWHAGNSKANHTQIGIELDPNMSRRAETEKTAAALIADLRGVYGNLPLSPHNRWTSTQCPGNWDLARLDRLARGVKPGIPVGGGMSVPAPSRPVRDPWESSPRVQGMSAGEVKKVQQALADRGYDLGKWGVDGKYGEATYSAVKAAQKALGVTVDGIAGPDTMNALTRAQKPAQKPKPSTSKAPAFPLPRRKGGLYYYGPPSGPKTSVSGRTRNSGAPGDVVLRDGRWHSKGLMLWQQRMLDRGWSGIGVADGRFGPKTERVVRQFQKSKGLGVDGKIGPDTWSAAWTEPVV